MTTTIPEKSSGRWVIPALLALWAFSPELRRLADWPLGFSALPVIAVIPLGATCLLALAVFRRRLRRLDLGFAIAFWAWMLGFGFSLLVGEASGTKLAGIYDYLQFVAPLLVGVFILRFGGPRTQPDIANSLAWIGAVVGVYGVFQYVSPPIWDALWVDLSGLSSIGQPVPFGLRVFSTLNSPGTCGAFLAIAVIFQLPYLGRGNTFWRLLAILSMMTALALTFVRSGWLALALGILVFVVLSPRRRSVLVSLVGVGVVSAALVFASPLALGNTEFLDALTQRFSTFQNIQSDDSYADRQLQTQTALNAALSEPLGFGLGTVGTATKLGDHGSTTVLDNGFLSRFVEMGFVGGLFYLFTILVGLAVAFSAWVGSRRDPMEASVLASCFAAQFATAGLDLAGDSHVALSGVLFWIALGIPALYVLSRGTSRVPALQAVAPAAA
jgi:O-antigen ligase